MFPLRRMLGSTADTRPCQSTGTLTHFLREFSDDLRKMFRVQRSAWFSRQSSVAFGRVSFTFYEKMDLGTRCLGSTI